MHAPTHAEHVAEVRFASEKRLVTWTTTLVFAPSVLFAITDRLVSPDATHLARLYALRLATFAMWGAGLLLLRPMTTRDQVRRLVFALSIGLVDVTLAVHAARPADNTYAVRAELLVAFLLFVMYPNRLAFQLGPALALAAGSVALLHWYNAVPAADLLSASSNFVVACAMGTLASRNRRQLEVDLTESLDRERAAIAARELAAAELRSLEGIVPICSYCHKVRTEVGDWERLDRYVRARTDADFSHGICPSCTAEHFPDLVLPSSTTQA